MGEVVKSREMYFAIYQALSRMNAGLALQVLFADFFDLSS